MTYAEYSAALNRLDILRHSWRELQPSEALRAQAESYLSTYSLKAADALQLAAAWAWSSGEVSGSTFLSGDTQLLGAAEKVGFEVVQV